MIDIILQMFSYPFLIRAFLVGILVSVALALLGVTLVLKRQSMLGDGLSHVGFGAISVALALNVAPLYIAIPVMVLAAFLLLRLKNSKVNSDAAIAVISSSSIAVGITAAACSGGMNTDVYGYMFGSILSVTKGDVIISSVLCAVTVLVFVLFYNKIFATTFDPNFAAASGTKTRPFDVLFALLTACAIVIGMRVMGTMLISGLIVFPALSAIGVCKSFKSTVIFASLSATVAFFVGMIASYAFAYIPAGAAIVLANLILFGIITLTKKLRGAK